MEEKTKDGSGDSAEPAAQKTWNGFHLSPGGFFQYRIEPDGEISVRRPWGDPVKDAKVIKFVQTVLIPFTKEIIAKAEAKKTSGSESAEAQPEPSNPKQEIQAPKGGA